MQSEQRPLSPAWCVAAGVMILFIWGNSLVPGFSSSQVSHGTASAIQTVLDSLGIASGWVTNFLVRKAAHLTEYAILGVLVMQAFAPGVKRDRRMLGVAALVLMLVPAIDETIQVCVPGRNGQVTDVLVDCTGALIGCLVRAAFTGIRTRLARAPENLKK